MRGDVLLSVVMSTVLQVVDFFFFFFFFFFLVALLSSLVWIPKLICSVTILSISCGAEYPSIIQRMSNARV